MRTLMATGRRTAYGEDGDAAVRALFGLTASVGAFVAAGAVAGGELPLIALPTLGLLGCLLVRAPTTVAAYAAGSVWLVFLPMATGERLIVPATMIVVCLAVAVGPDRLLSWLASDAAPEPVADVGEVGWIEEDDGRID